MIKLSTMAIVVSLLIVGGTLTANYYKELRDDELTKIAVQKSKYINLENPYYLDQEILHGNDASSTIIVFMANKSNYYSAQKEFDSGNYEAAIKFLNKINLKSFSTLKNDLLGDVYLYKEDNENARLSYEKALNTVSSKNLYLKEAIFSKYQKAFQ